MFGKKTVSSLLGRGKKNCNYTLKNIVLLAIPTLRNEWYRWYGWYGYDWYWRYRAGGTGGTVTNPTSSPSPSPTTSP
jgi:hypothetical protein